MTLAQQIITIGLCVLGTMTTRFLPFLVFRENRETPKFIQYVGKFLPFSQFFNTPPCLRNFAGVHPFAAIKRLIK